MKKNILFNVALFIFVLLYIAKNSVANQVFSGYLTLLLIPSVGAVIYSGMLLYQSIKRSDNQKPQSKTNASHKVTPSDFYGLILFVIGTVLIVPMVASMLYVSLLSILYIIGDY